MNRELINKRFESYLNEVEKHLDILKEDLQIFEPFFPMDGAKLEKLIQNRDYLRVFDQIAYRFLKLQEGLGKLLKWYFLKKGENVENITIVDIVNLAEKTGLDMDEDFWFRIRALRNSLVHEYGLKYEEVASALNSLRDSLLRIERLKNQLKTGAGL
ncbi:MAG: hypothetical protein GXN94_03970 [Aquificae bacterium]|nr:hypothetical protein [Aquificota bacterium]